MKIKITSKTHEHRDKLVPPGTELDVDDATGQAIIDAGAAVKADPVKSKKEVLDDHP